MNFCNQEIALLLVEHALTKYFILQNNFHFSLTNKQRAVLNWASLGHRLAGIKLLIQNINTRHVFILHVTSVTPEYNVRSEKSMISYCAQQAKCSNCPLTVEQFDPASPRRFEIVDLTVGLGCGCALNSPNLSRVLLTSLAIQDLRNRNFSASKRYSMYILLIQ